jgi:hypothetical protein
VLFLTLWPLHGYAQQIDDLFGTAIDMDQLSRATPIPAPIVVVAAVLKNEPVGLPVQAQRYIGLMLQLHRVSCRLENLIKGDPPHAEFDFFYFADPEVAQSVPNPKYNRAHMFRAEPGDRYIFFLLRQREMLRSVGDVGSFSVRVDSGRHPQRPELTAGRPEDTGEVGRIISDILLTPGQDLDPQGFAMAIPNARKWSIAFGSQLHTVDLLKGLLTLPVPIRTAACDELAQHYPSQYGCLADIHADSTNSEDTRQWAFRRLAYFEQQDARLEEQLLDPAALTYDSMAANLEELEIILGSPNPRIRTLACAALERYFPRSVPAQCRHLSPSR